MDCYKVVVNFHSFENIDYDNFCQYSHCAFMTERYSGSPFPTILTEISISDILCEVFIIVSWF